MNERIRQLVRQAGLDDVDFPIEDWDNVPLAKFAELIVKECMSLVSEPGPDMNDTERGILAQIKEHFGVEE